MEERRPTLEEFSPDLVFSLDCQKVRVDVAFVAGAVIGEVPSSGLSMDYTRSLSALAILRTSSTICSPCLTTDCFAFAPLVRVRRVVAVVEGRSGDSRRRGTKGESPEMSRDHWFSVFEGA